MRIFSCTWNIPSEPDVGVTAGAAEAARNQWRNVMNLSTLLGAAVLALLATPTFAQDLAGGAIQTTMIDNKEVLADSNGMTLYTYDDDMIGVSNCYDECATAWPPLMAAAGAQPEGDYTIVERKDGTRMWAYMGRPLYLYAKDTKPGDVSGDGVEGEWHIALTVPVGG
jgi:predicted lipoprotein with Yx(FWY)xxD motif